LPASPYRRCFANPGKNAKLEALNALQAGDESDHPQTMEGGVLSPLNSNCILETVEGQKVINYPGLNRLSDNSRLRGGKIYITK